MVTMGIRSSPARKNELQFLFGSNYTGSFEAHMGDNSTNSSQKIRILQGGVVHGDVAVSGLHSDAWHNYTIKWADQAGAMKVLTDQSAAVQGTYTSSNTTSNDLGNHTNVWLHFGARNSFSHMFKGHLSHIIVYNKWIGDEKIKELHFNSDAKVYEGSIQNNRVNIR